MLDNPMRFMSEVEFLGRGFILPNPVMDVYSKITSSSVELNLKKAVNSEKTLLQAKIGNEIGEKCFNIIAKKNRSKALIEKQFQKGRQLIADRFKEAKPEV
mmetsp:Transcript_23051/g.22443  ORF Transcript_23051/g.22443 Transcript_23051/m.22443 type:complete len:101 (+) Transcript_23051:1718-2020(+)